MLWPRRSSSPQRMRRRRPVVLCVDVEPDARTFDPADPPPWNGFERFLERLPPLRQHLEQITDAPVRVTWFLRMDPQVEQTWGSPEWVVDAYGAALDELWEGGDELGLHTHTWRWGHEDWYTEREDEAWTARCIDGGVDAFERALSRRCEAHRGGDHYLDGPMLERLEARGVRVDLTVEPGQRPGGALPGEPARGAGPDYRGIPTAPYRSRPARFPEPTLGGTGPLLIPLVSAIGGRRIARTPIPPDTSPARFVPRLELELLVREPAAAPVLAFAVRSDAALGPRWDALTRNLDHIARRHAAAFVTASEAAERFERPPEPAASRGT